MFVHQWFSKIGSHIYPGARFCVTSTVSKFKSAYSFCYHLFVIGISVERGSVCFQCKNVGLACSLPTSFGYVHSTKVTQLVLQ